MKVFPNFGNEQTFSLSELASALELVRTQNADGLLSGRCPACQYQHSPADGDDEPFTKVESSALSIASVTVNPVPAVATQTVAVGPTPQTVTGPETVPATQGIPFTPTVPTAPVPVMGPSALVPPTQAGAAGTSTSTRWYVVTVGRETGVFQGWHNVHPHVIGVPGACYGRHSSLAAAQTAYSEAINDGGVMEVPH
ncbi:hypothetical protein EV424DRAFT_1542933 [Suillus variegatus]|nr:hypothetical protein EV424DRAFT_1542933 [Suillus variegatus]